MTAHALKTSDTPPPAQPPTPAEKTPTAVKVMRNADAIVLLVSLVIFLVASLPMAGWLAGAGAWGIQRAINELAVRRAEASDDARTRVGLLAGSMILRGWVVAGIIVTVGLTVSHQAGLAAAVLFLAVFTLQFTLTMAMRPAEIAAERARAKPERARAKPERARAKQEPRA